MTYLGNDIQSYCILYTIQGENCVHSFIKYLYVDMFLTNLVDFCYLQGGLQASKHGIPGETSKNEVFN